MRVVVVVITLVAATAHADPETAKQLGAEAEALVAAGDLVSAGAKFRAAYKAEPLPEYMCNSGVAYHKAKDLPRSHRYLNLCVTMGSALDPAYRANLRTVVETIQTQLVAGEFTPIDIAVDPPTAVVVFEGGRPYDEEIVGGGRIWVPYGSYRLLVRADGYLDGTHTIDAKSHDAMPLRVTLDKPPVDKPIVTGPTRVAAPPSKLPAIIATSATGAFAIGAVVFYSLARGDLDDADDAIDRAAFDDLHDRAHTKQKISWTLAGVAGIGAVVSTYLWYRVLKAPSKIEVTATGNGVGVRGTF